MYYRSGTEMEDQGRPGEGTGRLPPGTSTSGPVTACLLSHYRFGPTKRLPLNVCITLNLVNLTANSTLANCSLYVRPPTGSSTLRELYGHRFCTKTKISSTGKSLRCKIVGKKSRGKGRPVSTLNDSTF